MYEAISINQLKFLQTKVAAPDSPFLCIHMKVCGNENLISLWNWAKAWARLVRANVQRKLLINLCTD